MDSSEVECTLEGSLDVLPAQRMDEVLVDDSEDDDEDVDVVNAEESVDSFDSVHTFWQQSPQVLVAEVVYYQHHKTFPGLVEAPSDPATDTTPSVTVESLVCYPYNYPHH